MRVAKQLVAVALLTWFCGCGADQPVGWCDSACQVHCGVRENCIFIPNDARWYVNLPIVHNRDPKTVWSFCNSTNVAPWIFVET